MSQAIIIIIMLTVAGLAVLYVGLRGVGIRAKPHCRKCKYTLYPPNEGAVCPECGLDLSKKRNVKRGHRRRLRSMIGTSILLLLSALLGGSWFAWQGLRDFEWNTVKPVWWLRQEAFGLDSSNAVPAREELLWRLDRSIYSLQEDGLSRSQISGIVDLALAHQGDPSTAWPDEWGWFIEDAWGAGLVSEPQIRRYLRNSFQPGIRFDVRRMVRSSAVLPIRVVYGPFRTCAATRFVAELRLGESKLGDQRLVPGFMRDEWRMSSATSLTEERYVPQNLPAGDYSFTIQYHVSFAFDGRRTSVADWQSVTVLDVTIVPRSQATVVPIRDERLAQAIAEAIIVDPIRLDTSPDSFDISRFVVVQRPPVDFAFDVMLRSGHKQTKVGELVAFRDGGFRHEVAKPYSMTYSFLADLGEVSLALSPNERVAERTVDITEMWYRDIVFPHVPVLQEESSRD